MEEKDTTRQKLRVFRIRQGLSQEAMAHKMGIGRTTYSLVETGKSPVSVAFIAKLRAAFPYENFDWLFPLPEEGVAEASSINYLSPQPDAERIEKRLEELYRQNELILKKLDQILARLKKK